MADREVTLRLSAKADGDPAKPLNDMGRAAQKAAEEVRKLQQQQRIAASQFGLGAASGNIGGMAAGAAGMAMGLGPAAGGAAAFAAISIGAGKAARALEVFQNSTLNAGQKADALAKEFIPGAKQFIELRRALNGVNEMLRRTERQLQIDRLRISGQGEIGRAELERIAEMRHFGMLARGYGEYAGSLANRPPAGAIMPRGTVAEEIAFQNAQRLLPGRYAMGRAQAEAGAARRDFTAQESVVESLRKEQRRLLNQRDQQMSALQRSRRSVNFDPFGALTDENQNESSRHAADAERTILRIEENREKLVQELNRQKQLGLTLAEKEAAVRKAQISIEQGELANLQGKEQRSANLAFRIGSMSPGEKLMTLSALRSAQKVGLSHLPPSLRRRIESFFPEYAQKQYEKTAPNDPLWKEVARLGGEGFIDEKGDFAALRKIIQEKAAKIEVQIILNEEQTAQKLAKALGPFFADLVKQFKVLSEDRIEEMRRGQMQQNARQ